MNNDDGTNKVSTKFKIPKNRIRMLSFFTWSFTYIFQRQNYDGWLGWLKNCSTGKNNADNFLCFVLFSNYKNRIIAKKLGIVDLFP